MNELVFRNNDQVVTSSRNVARDFNKEHRAVLKAIDDLIKDGVALNNADLFYETTYTHEQNKQEYRQYLMNRDGFTLLVMGFTGKEAMKFKLDYINAFNEMEQELKKPKSQLEIMQMAVNELTNHDKRISHLEENMRIDGGQEFQIRKKANHVVVEALGGKETPAYEQLSRKAFSEFWRDFKNHFNLPRYGDLPKKQFEEGLRFIGMWQPSTGLRIEIESVNSQQQMRVV